MGKRILANLLICRPENTISVLEAVVSFLSVEQNGPWSISGYPEYKKLMFFFGEIKRAVFEYRALVKK